MKRGAVCSWSLFRVPIYSSVHWADIDVSARSQALAGKTFVLTSSLSTMTREEAGSKLQKALTLGVVVLDEKDFLSLLRKFS